MPSSKFWTGSRWVVVDAPGEPEVSGPEESEQATPATGVHSWLPKVLMVGALGLAAYFALRAEPRSQFAVRVTR